MEESAPCPLVSDRAISVASSIDSTAWVAPNSCAFWRLNATGSTAMTWAAPACTAPCTAFAPIPPMPITITVWPGCTAAELTADPQPVPTEQPVRHATSRGTSSGIFTAECTDTVVFSQKVEMPAHLADRRAVRDSRKLVGSSGRQPASRNRPRSQRFWCPLAHHRQRPQPGRKEKTTWSPSA